MEGTSPVSGPETRKPDKGLRLIHAIGALGLMAAVTSVYLAVDRSPPITFISGAVDPREAIAGSALSVEREIEWLRFDCTNTVIGYIQDSDGRHHKQEVFSAPTPDKDKCIADTAERDKKNGTTRDAPTCIVPSRSDPPRRGILSSLKSAYGPATYNVTVEFHCGLIGVLMRPIKVTATPLRFTIK